jgi:hypothetical protein
MADAGGLTAVIGASFALPEVECLLNREHKGRMKVVGSIIDDFPIWTQIKNFLNDRFSRDIDVYWPDRTAFANEFIHPHKFIELPLNSNTLLERQDRHS